MASFTSPLLLPTANSGADLLTKSSESPRVSKRHEKLDKLLRAIESYDRSVENIEHNYKLKSFILLHYVTHPIAMTLRYSVSCTDH